MNQVSISLVAVSAYIRPCQTSMIKTNKNFCKNATS